MGYDISKAIAAFEERGIKLSASQKSAVEEVLAKEYREATEKYVSDKLSTSDEKEKVSQAEAWVTRLFVLAEDLSKEFDSKERNQGRGRIEERVLNDIETPNGKLKVSLTRTLSGE